MIQPAEFLPEWSQMPDGNRYRPLYRLFAGAAWRQVWKDKLPVLCDSATEAVTVARNHVREMLNSRMRADRCAIEADVLGIEEWRQRKAGEAEAERRRVFGDQPAAFVRNKSGRMAVVETRRRRA